MVSDDLTDNISFINQNRFNTTTQPIYREKTKTNQSQEKHQETTVTDITVRKREHVRDRG